LLAIFCSSPNQVYKVLFFLIILIELQPVQEETKKDITDKDVEMGFDISHRKHKGQVFMHRFAHMMKILI